MMGTSKALGLTAETAGQCAANAETDTYPNPLYAKECESKTNNERLPN